MADDFGWRRFLIQLAHVVQHTLVMTAVIVSLWATAHVVEWFFPPGAWFRTTLPFLEERAMMGVVVVLFIGLVFDFLRGIGKG